MPSNVTDLAIGDILKNEQEYKQGFKGTRSNLYNLAELIGECEDGILGEKYLDQVKLDIMKADGDACRGILEVDDMLGSVREMKSKNESRPDPPPPSVTADLKGASSCFVPRDSCDFTAFMRTAVENKKTIGDAKVKGDSRISALSKMLGVEWNGKRKRGGGDDDDDIQVVGGNKEEELKCPMTRQFFVNPMRNTVCNHTVDQQSIDQLRKARKTHCANPGCSNKTKGVDQKYFVEDEDMKLRIQSWKRRKEKEEKKRRQEEEEDDVL
ncbi:hypothetical protein TrCOL_g4966 [Triparma columacea]|uniref:SP-RING-type domain-containing protein n=1 Tax=Triparma columacea TaxID=722753 RepID=A0A9W7GHQ4_9STRA|nr:hypothetical protein TrCOL_g4966 [Triparma columacea]